MHMVGAHCVAAQQCSVASYVACSPVFSTVSKGQNPADARNGSTCWSDEHPRPVLWCARLANYSALQLLVRLALQAESSIVLVQRHHVAVVGGLG